jgi:hypothetical protein
VERKHGSLGRVWVFDRGIVSEENLALLRQRGAFYLVATPKRKLAAFEHELLKEEDWAAVSGRPEIEVKLVERDGELYVLSRSRERAERERSIRLRALHGLRKDLTKLSKAVRTGRLRQRDLILKRLGRLEERWRECVAVPQTRGTNRRGTGLAVGSPEITERLVATGCLPVTDQPRPRGTRNPLAPIPAALPKSKASFAPARSALNLRPIWHRIQPRVEAHIMVAFLGYCLWVCLKQKLKAAAASLTPAQVLHQLKQILLVEVSF